MIEPQKDTESYCRIEDQGGNWPLRLIYLKPEITRLRIKGCQSQQWEYIVESINDHCQLTCLELVSCQLTPQLLHKLSLPNLLTLNLADNSLNDGIVDTILRHRSIASVDLSGNPLLSQRAAIRLYLQAPGLRELSLSIMGCQTLKFKSMKGCSKILKYAREWHFPQLVSLSLSKRWESLVDCGISSTEVRNIVRNFPQVQKLSLLSNPIGDEGLTTIASRMTQLKYVNVGLCSISNEGAKQLAHFGTTSLLEVSMGTCTLIEESNRVSRQALQHLLRALPHLVRLGASISKSGFSYPASRLATASGSRKPTSCLI